MSYILEALRKADQERTVGHVPDLEAVHQTGQAASHKRRWIWIVGALLLLNGILIAVLTLRNGSVPDEKPVTGRELADNDRSQAASGGLPDDTAPADTYQPPRRASPPVTAGSGKTPAYRAPAKAPSPRPRETGKVIVAESPLSLEDEGVVTPATGSAPVDNPAAPAAPVDSPPGIPDWNDLSLEFRSSFQAPRVDVHVYDTDPQRRFVLVNLKKYREGERLDSGALLEEILPDGIQLLYQGTQFVYRK